MVSSTDKICIIISAIHTNRTVRLKTDYNFLDHEFRQKSVLHLDPHSWASYDVTIINKTTVSYIHYYMFCFMLKPLTNELLCALLYLNNGF
jgi:hypothetical protein